MSNKPIFVAAHPRACSTAFERVFMTRRDDLACVHEPFGDAFYYGPERLGARFENDEKAREESGFATSTYKTIFDRIENEGKEGKRVFIKDIAYYLVPPDGQSAAIAASLGGRRVKKGVGTNGQTNGVTNGASNGIANGTANGINGVSNGTNGVSNGINGTNGTNGTSNGAKTAPFPYDTDPEPGNPTVVPTEILKKFHFTFLIRHPRYSIPSYWRCTIPPLDKVTGFYDFMPNEAGYDEQRRIFDYLREQKQVGPAIAGRPGEVGEGEVSITVIDADDLLDNPESVVSAFCREVGLEYSPKMLNWDNPQDQKTAVDAFEKWPGFHDDAINSTSLKPRDPAHFFNTDVPKKKKEKSVETENQEWREKYGEEAQKIIREAVDANIADYEYMKSFCVKV